MTIACKLWLLAVVCIAFLYQDGPQGNGVLCVKKAKHSYKDNSSGDISSLENNSDSDSQNIMPYKPAALNLKKSNPELLKKINNITKTSKSSKSKKDPNEDLKNFMSKILTQSSKINNNKQIDPDKKIHTNEHIRTFSTASCRARRILENTRG
ncbi:hypothetical protein ACI65C_008780 [Semiaphis heraclei]